MNRPDRTHRPEHVSPTDRTNRPEHVSATDRMRRPERRSSFERVLALLEQKLDIAREQQERRALLATHPRESMRVALQDRCREVDAQILLLDAEFNVAYAAYRATLPMHADGSIDVDALDPAAREALSRLQRLVQKISALTFQTSQDTVR